MMFRYTNLRIVRIGTLLAIFTATLLLPFFPLQAQEQDTVVFTLDDCIEAALKHNPQILASALTVDESGARIDEIRAGYYPTLSLNATAGRFGWENNAGAGTTGKENISSGLFARYMVFQGFKTASAVSAAKANHQSNRAQHKVNREELVVLVTEAYYRLLQAERFAAVAEQSLQRAQMHLDFSKALFKTGLAKRSDILKAKVAQSDAQLSLIGARNARLAAQGKLNLLMGRGVQLPLKIKDNLGAINSVADSGLFIDTDQFEEFVRLAFQNRPEMERIDGQIKAQQANIRIARSDYFPTVSVDGNYTYAGETSYDLNSSYYIGATLSFPLFNGFARPARVRQENLALQNLIQQQESMRQQISLEVWNAFLQVKEAAERVLNSRIFLDNARESRDIAEGEYREGVGSMLDVIDAQTAFVTAEQKLIEALADYKIALTTLNRAVGKKNIREMLK